MESNHGARTAKCLKCGRVRHFRTEAAALAAGPHGRVCAARIRLAAITEAVKGFAQAQVEKARELIADGGRLMAKEVVDDVRSYVLTCVQESAAFGEIGMGDGTRGAEVSIKR